MNTHAQFSMQRSVSLDIDLHQKILFEIHTRYDVDCNLASEMAWDLIEMITAVDADVEMLDKYFLS